MIRTRHRWLRKTLVWAVVAFFAKAGVARAADTEADLRARLEQQGKMIEALQQQMQALKAQSAVAAKGSTDPAAKGSADPAQLDEGAVKKIVADYLKDNPGAGMPPSVQTGYDPAGGFAIRSTAAPQYVPWNDESKIPFELRFRGRLQLDYYGYKVTDNLNHLTGVHYHPAVGDFSALEIKRLRLIWEGTAFDPNLRYHFELDGNTRGLGGTLNNRQIANNDPAAGTTGGASGIGSLTGNPATGGGVTVDNSVRLFSAYVAYDLHGCAAEKGCGPDCPDGTYKYAPTYTLIIGKIKPYFAFEEYMGSGNQQMVEYGMSEWMFDADDDNLTFCAGLQVKARDDRLWASFLVTNGSDSQFPDTQLDKYPGVNIGFWYDFGGTWNQQRHRWDLYGDTPSDIDYSCHPVVRVGATSNLVPLDRRSIYGDDEQSRYFVMSDGPGGTRLINLLNGGTPTNTAGTSNNAVDSFDAYSFEAFVAAKYKGFSILNDWFVRDLTDWHSAPGGRDIIRYTDGFGRNDVFPRNALVDFGTAIQAGYFIVPHKEEIVARVDIIEGESGDIPKPGSSTTVANAFTHYHAAYEYALGFNYFWKRELLKWQTDISYYQGGNPAGGGASPAGFIPGVDGWMLRSQIQLAF